MLTNILLFACCLTYSFVFGIIEKRAKCVGIHTFSWSVMVSCWFIGANITPPVPDFAFNLAKELCVVSQEYRLNGNPFTYNYSNFYSENPGIRLPIIQVNLFEKAPLIEDWRAEFEYNAAVHCHLRGKSHNVALNHSCHWLHNFVLAITRITKHKHNGQSQKDEVGITYLKSFTIFKRNRNHKEQSNRNIKIHCEIQSLRGKKHPYKLGHRSDKIQYEPNLELITHLMPRQLLSVMQLYKAHSNNVWSRCE